MVQFVGVASSREAERTRAYTSLMDSLVTANAHLLVLRNGRLEGAGAELPLREATRSQFLVIGEEHNVVEIPELMTALFKQLQNAASYKYIALEQDPVTMRIASREPVRGNIDSLTAIARRYPHAFTFMSDDELRMIADIGGVSSGRGNPVWGLDQSFGVTTATSAKS